MGARILLLPFLAAVLLGCSLTGDAPIDGLVVEPQADVPPVDDEQALASEVCVRNLEEIYRALELYKIERGRYPSQSGVAFLTEPWKRGIIKRTPEGASIYRCPGDCYDSPFETPDNIRLGGNIDSSMVSYAGRNQEDFPIDFSQRATQIIACDDDEHGSHHDGFVHVLYMDGHVESIDIDELGAEGFRIGEHATRKEFRVLSNHPIASDSVATLREMEVVHTACQFFEVVYGRLPVRLDELTNPPSGDPPYLEPWTDLVDAWGKKYKYAVIEGDPVLRSLGSDAREGGGDEARDLVWPAEGER